MVWSLDILNCSYQLPPQPIQRVVASLPSHAVRAPLRICNPISRCSGRDTISATTHALWTQTPSFCICKYTSKHVWKRRRWSAGEGGGGAVVDGGCVATGPGYCGRTPSTQGWAGGFIAVWSRSCCVWTVLNFIIRSVYVARVCFATSFDFTNFVSSDLVLAKTLVWITRTVFVFIMQNDVNTINVCDTCVSHIFSRTTALFRGFHLCMLCFLSVLPVLYLFVFKNLFYNVGILWSWKYYVIFRVT